MNDAKEAQDTLQEVFDSSPQLDLLSSDRFIILSDLHLGNGKKSDDFLGNSQTVIALLQSYYDAGWTLILNGDIEELLRFEYEEIRLCWHLLYDVIEGFQQSNRLWKLTGNHDIDLWSIPNVYPPLVESLRFNWNGNCIFIFHGHQVSKAARASNHALGFVLKYFANPLRIKNFSLRNDSARRFKVEKAIYNFSVRQRIVSIIGHTHRPLFESMSKYDSLRFEIEQLCQEFIDSSLLKQAEIRSSISLLRNELEELINRDKKSDYRSSLYSESLVVPCMFNAGTVIGKRGMTGIELCQGRIRLIHWFREGQSLRHRGSPIGTVQYLPEASCYRRLVREDMLDNVFSRIDLLGG